MLLLVLGCGADCDDVDYLTPNAEWAEAFRERGVCITGDPDFSEQAPVYQYTSADGNGGQVGSCGIEINENRRGTPLDLPTYIHEFAHLRFGVGHGDAEVRTRCRTH